MMCNLEKEVADKKAAFEALSHENEVLRQRTSILEKVVSCRDEQLNLLTAFTNRCNSAPAGLGSCFGSTLLDASVIPLASQESFRNMKKEQVIPHYKSFLTEVSSYLLHCQYPCTDPHSPVVQKVTECVERLGSMMKGVVLLNPKLMRQLLALNLETLQPATVADGHWDGVVASLQLTPGQRSDILAVFELYRAVLSKVYEERRLIMEVLGDGPHTLEPSATSFVARNDLATEMELTERLAANMAKEESAQTLLCCFFFGKVLAAPQFAKVAVYSWPFFPDSLAVANAVLRTAEPRSSSGSGSGR